MKSYCSEKRKRSLEDATLVITCERNEQRKIKMSRKKLECDLRITVMMTESSAELLILLQISWFQELPYFIIHSLEATYRTFLSKTIKDYEIRLHQLVLRKV